MQVEMVHATAALTGHGAGPSWLVGCGCGRGGSLKAEGDGWELDGRGGDGWFAALKRGDRLDG
jgi:hypothetical protein